MFGKDFENFTNFEICQCRQIVVSPVKSHLAVILCIFFQSANSSRQIFTDTFILYGRRATTT